MATEKGPIRSTRCARSAVAVAFTVLSCLPACGQYFERAVPIASPAAPGATERALSLLMAGSANKLYVISLGAWAAVLDCSSNRVVRDIPVEFGELRAEWVLWSDSRQKAYLQGWEGIQVVDGQTDSIVGRVRSCPGSVRGMVYDDSGDCLVACDTMDKSLLIVDGLTNTIRARIRWLHRNPWQVAWDYQNRKYYVLCHSGGLYSDSCWLTICDARTYTILDSLPLGAVGYGPMSELTFVAEYGRLYVGLESTVVVLDCATDSIIRRLPFPGEDMAYNPVSGRLYCIQDSIRIVDTGPDTLLRTLYVGQRHYVPHRSALGTELRKLYVGADDHVSVIDCVTDSVVANVPTTTGPISIAWCEDERCAYVAALDGTLLVVDGNTNLVSDTVYCGSILWDLLWNPVLSKLYVLSGRSGSPERVLISAVDSTGTLLKSFPAGTSTEDETRLRLDPTGTKVYCAIQNESVIKVIGCSSDTVEKEIPVAAEPCNLEVNPVTGKLYCIHHTDPGLLTVIDCSADTVEQVVPLPLRSPYTVTRHPGVNKLYVRHYGGPISVFDCSSNQVVALISIGGPSWGIACDSANAKVYASVQAFNRALYSIDARADTVLSRYGQLQMGGWVVCSPLAGKTYFWATMLPPGPCEVIGMVDCVTDSFLGMIFPPLFSIDNHARPVYHPSQPLVYVPMNGTYQASGVIDRQGIGVLDCISNRIVSIIDYPTADRTGNAVAVLDQVAGRVYSMGSSRVYLTRHVLPGLEAVGGQRARPQTDLHCSPSPFFGRCRVTGSGPATQDLVVYDRSGRVVRALAPRAEGRSSTWLWDGMDSAGRAMPAGVYFARQRTAPSSEPGCKLVKLR